MEPLPISQLLIGAGTVAAAAIAAAIVGRRRGLDQVEARSDSALRETLDAQDRRIALQDREIADLRAQVAALTAQVATLTSDLHRSDAALRMALSAARDDGR